MRIKSWRNVAVWSVEPSPRGNPLLCRASTGEVDSSRHGPRTDSAHRDLYRAALHPHVGLQRSLGASQGSPAMYLTSRFLSFLMSCQAASYALYLSRISTSRSSSFRRGSAAARAGTSEYAVSTGVASGFYFVQAVWAQIEDAHVVPTPPGFPRFFDAVHAFSLRVEEKLSFLHFTHCSQSSSSGISIAEASPALREGCTPSGCRWPPLSDTASIPRAAWRR